jgi:hypothetical protein
MDRSRIASKDETNADSFHTGGRPKKIEELSQLHVKRCIQLSAVALRALTVLTMLAIFGGPVKPISPIFASALVVLTIEIDLDPGRA